MTNHPLILFYAKDKNKEKENEPLLEEYKKLPIILFVSREPNGKSGIEEKDKDNVRQIRKCLSEKQKLLSFLRKNAALDVDKIGYYDHTSYQTGNWRLPLAVIANILWPEIDAKKEIKEQCSRIKNLYEKGKSPIVFSYRFPFSLPYGSNGLTSAEISKIRSYYEAEDYERHLNNIKAKLSLYNVSVIIDHAVVEENGEKWLELSKNRLLLNVYLGGRKGYVKIAEEVRSAVGKEEKLKEKVLSVWKAYYPDFEKILSVNHVG